MVLHFIPGVLQGGCATKGGSINYFLFPKKNEKRSGGFFDAKNKEIRFFRKKNELFRHANETRRVSFACMATIRERADSRSKRSAMTTPIEWYRYRPNPSTNEHARAILVHGGGPSTRVWVPNTRFAVRERYKKRDAERWNLPVVWTGTYSRTRVET